MASATFVLKEPNSLEETLVYLIFRYNSQRLKYSTGQKIDPQFWNPESQKARETRLFHGYTQFNALLKKIEGAVFDVYRRFLIEDIEPTPEQLREALNVCLNRKEAARKLNLISFAENFIEKSNRRPNTIKHYKQTLRKLKEYAEASGQNLGFDFIDLNFYESFVRWMQGKDFGVNTIGGIIKNVKVFMNEAFDRRLTNSLDFKNRRFRTIEEPTENIYLSEDEIQKIYELDLSNNPRLSKVRDLFIIGCYTGLRFSDLVQLRNENLLENKNMMRIKTEKTGEIVVIPIHKFIRSILDRNNGIIPDTISNQKMNGYLKELAQHAGINEDVIINSTKGGHRISGLFKKWELVTVHTARRSFATNAYLKDVPTISIMKITGHRSEKTFLKYIKISQEDNANKLINHPFFN